MPLKKFLSKYFLKKFWTISGAASSVLLEIAYSLAKYLRFAWALAKVLYFPPSKNILLLNFNRIYCKQQTFHIQIFPRGSLFPGPFPLEGANLDIPNLFPSWEYFFVFLWQSRVKGCLKVLPGLGFEPTCN